MEYESLNNIYRKNPSAYDETYNERFNSPLTRHFDFQIKEFNHQHNYPAFFCYTEEFALLIQKIYKKNEELLQILDSVPYLLMDQFLLSCAVDEIRATSDIEGIHSTHKEIKDAMNGTIHSTRFSSIVGKYKLILGNKQINFKTCEDIRIFYDEFIHNEVSAENPTNALDGKIFRKDSVDITSSSGKTIHRGVYPEEKIINYLNIALELLNNENIPVLERISIFHYIFEYIHPFYDGNGRTARFIVSYMLAEHFHQLIALRLSVVLKKNRKQYYDMFKETDSNWNKGDLTPFVLKFSTILLETFDDILSALNNKVMQVVKYQYDILPKLVHGDNLTMKIYIALLHSSTFFSGGISMEGLIKFTGKSRNTIKSRLDLIPNEHIIKTGDKKIFYKLNTMIFTGH